MPDNADAPAGYRVRSGMTNRLRADRVGYALLIMPALLSGLFWLAAPVQADVSVTDTGVTPESMTATGAPAVPLTAAQVAARYVPDAAVVGAAQMTFMLWDVYVATLHAPGGVWREEQPFALALAYQRQLRGKDIAKRSVKEMREQGFDDENQLAAWHEEMQQIFPDVYENTTLTGVRDARGYAIFYRNGERIGIIEEPAFSDWFFGIWLNEQTSEPALRKKLLGMSE